MGRLSDENFIKKLAPEVQAKLRDVTDPKQREVLIRCLRNGEEIPDFAWMPISDLSEKLDMLKKLLASAEPKEQSFDMSFRPASYWETPNPMAGVLSRIKGEQRKRQVKELLESGDKELIEDWMLSEKLSEADRQALGRIHPLLMGGEYLPDLKRGEVEIARVAMQSTTGDVISIRARRKGKRIHYRVVDEYEEDGCSYRCKPRSSSIPLTMQELINLIDTARMEGEEEFGQGLVEPFRNSNAESIETLQDLEQMRHFISVSSEFYPELEAYYEAEADKWFERTKQEMFEG